MGQFSRWWYQSSLNKVLPLKIGWLIKSVLLWKWVNSIKIFNCVGQFPHEKRTVVKVTRMIYLFMWKILLDRFYGTSRYHSIFCLFKSWMKPCSSYCTTIPQRIFWKIRAVNQHFVVIIITTIGGAVEAYKVIEFTSIKLLYHLWTAAITSQSSSSRLLLVRLLSHKIPKATKCL